MPKLFPILAAPHFANNSPLVLMFFSFRSKPTCVGARRRKTSRRSRLGVNSKPRRRRRAKQDVRSNRFSSSSIRAPAFMNMKDFFSSFASHQTLLSQKKNQRSRRFFASPCVDVTSVPYSGGSLGDAALIHSPILKASPRLHNAHSSKAFPEITRDESLIGISLVGSRRTFFRPS